MSLNVRRHRRLLGLALSGARLNASPEQVRAALALSEELIELRLSLRRAGLLAPAERLTEVQVTGAGLAACLEGHWLRRSGRELQRWDGQAWVEAEAWPLLGLAPAGPAPLTQRRARALLADRTRLQVWVWTPLIAVLALTASVATLTPLPLASGLAATWLALSAVLNSPGLLLILIASLLVAREAMIRLRTLDLSITGVHLDALQSAQAFGPAWAGESTVCALTGGAPPEAGLPLTPEGLSGTPLPAGAELKR